MGLEFSVLSAKEISFDIRRIGKRYQKYANSVTDLCYDGHVINTFNEEELEHAFKDVGVESLAQRRLISEHFKTKFHDGLFFVAALKGDMSMINDISTRRLGLDVNFRYPRYSWNKDTENSEFYGYETALQAACKFSHPPFLVLIARLLDLGAEVLVKDCSGNTPLHGACSMSQTELVKLLLSRGANLYAKDELQRTPRQHAHGINQFAIEVTMDRWPSTMTILCLKGLCLFQSIDMSMIDLVEFLGHENDFL